MKGSEFKRKVERLGRTRGIAVSFDKKRGKGSHATLSYGEAKTVLKDLRKDIGPSLLSDMCKQLGIDARDL